MPCHLLTLLCLTALLGPIAGQLKFGGSRGGSSSSSSGGSSSGTKDLSPADGDTRFFGLTTGNQAVDGGILGLGLGAIGAAVLGPTIGQALTGSSNSGCGRRKRQADGEERFFLPTGSSCTCGRRKRQAPGENQPNTKFFNLFGGQQQQQQHCGSCCYGSSQPSNNFNNGNNYNQCQCDYNKTFRDQYGNTHGACRRADNSGRTWCYTTGWSNTGCRDLQSSQRFPNNPWSYRACSNQG